MPSASSGATTRKGPSSRRKRRHSSSRSTRAPPIGTYSMRNAECGLRIELWICGLTLQSRIANRQSAIRNPQCGMVRHPPVRFPCQQSGGSTGGRTLMRALVVTLAALLSVMAAVSSTSAQHFGRNKVQVQSFAFKVLPTPHFDVSYYPAGRQAAVLAARMAERWYERLAKALQHTLAARPPIVLYASQAQFTQTTVIPDLLPEGVGGFTDHD